MPHSPAPANHSSCLLSVTCRSLGQRTQRTRNPMVMRMTRISTGSKSSRSALVETKVSPHTMTENNAAMCPGVTDPSAMGLDSDSTISLF